MTQQEIAARIAQLRRRKSFLEERDVTQAEVAGATGISLESYSRYENGKRRPPEGAIEKLAAFFGVTAVFIRYGIGEQPITTFRIPDSMAEMFSRALRDEAPPSPTADPPAEGPPAPQKKAAGDRPGRGRPKGRR